MKISRRIFYIVFTWIICHGLIFLDSCVTPVGVSNQEYSIIYEKQQSKLNPEITAYHLNNEKSRVFIRINASNLLYAKNMQSENMQARICISYLKYFSYESKSIIDSGSFIFSDEKNYQTDNSVLYSFDFPSATPLDFILKVNVKDLNKKEEKLNYIHLTRNSNNSRSNFLLFSNKNAQPVFRNYNLPEESLGLTFNDLNKDKLYARYYYRTFPIAPPPFSNVNPVFFNYTADSIKQIKLTSGSNYTVSIPSEGFVHFQADTLDREGFTLFRFNEGFPKMSSPKLMIPPLRYLTSRQEYDELTAAENNKKALDDFWLGLTGNKERAKELIKVFYNRAQNANQLFTSYTEGWKTDRGMIYLIYGEPDLVYKSNFSETWTYGEANNLRSIEFTFVKVNNPFTDNDYSLNRNQMFKDSWYLAVDTWRQGRVFNP